MFSSRSLVAIAGGLLIAACNSNPPFAPETHQGDLTAEVAFSVAEFSILEEFEIEVTVRDADGNVVTDVESLQAEFRHHDDTEWRAVPLEGHADHFAATHMLPTSGEYDFRVTGVPHGETEVHVLYEAAEHFLFERAHFEAHGTRVEFETFPGHIHEGDEAALRFWIFEDDHGGSGHVAMQGLTVQIHCFEGGVQVEEYAAEEHEAGVYEAHHTFTEAGDGGAEIHFQVGAEEVHGAFNFPVSHGH